MNERQTERNKEKLHNNHVDKQKEKEKKKEKTSI
jgi:hypothetical protein